MNLPACVRIEADDFRSRESLLKDGWEEVEILETWQRVIGSEDFECGLITHVWNDEFVKRLAYEGGEHNRICVSRGAKETRKYFNEWIDRAIVNRQPFSVIYPAGFIILREDGAIDLLRVESGTSQQGVGTKLVNRAMIYFRDRGIRTIRAGTQAHNEPAQRFYSKLGFTVVKRERTFHKDLD